MIKLSNVYKSFDNRTILSNLNLSVQKNEYICITGESGAGKTTLLNLIGLLDKPDSGEISINGKTQFSSKDISKLRRNFFGYIFQDFLLMDDKTVQANLEISKNISNYSKENYDQKNVHEILQMVGLDSSYLSKKVCHLSGGEQQKISIARMLLKPCELVLADEPTGNLDRKNKNEIIEIFKELKKNGKTIICVTHDADVAQSADRIINLKKL